VRKRVSGVGLRVVGVAEGRVLCCWRRLGCCRATEEGRCTRLRWWWWSAAGDAAAAAGAAGADGGGAAAAMERAVLFMRAAMVWMGVLQAYVEARASRARSRGRERRPRRFFRR
jgi:hypothetical protein